MNMKTIKLCRECGKPLSPDALLGLCPECMMKAGLPTSSRATIAVAPDAFVEGPETETKEFVPGTKLGYFGDYELLEEIARGGMGVVYKARQSSLKRIVAIKMIRSGELADEAAVRRFHTEAQAAAQLQHPNIVAIHEIGEHEGRHYFSMDFIEGKNLAQVASGRPVEAGPAAEWLKAIAGAVQFAHQRGVLHRDLKPQNIVLDAGGRPRVTDFGLAKNLAGDSTLTDTGAVMGSPSYMSPEQARGRNDLVGPATDVYSLGTVLYELLTGRPPFHGKTAMDTLSQVVNDEPPRPRTVNPGAPVDLETICLKCLEKDPVRRYPTARELEADLSRFLAGEPVQARPANALRRTMSWFRGHRWVFSALVSVLLLTLTGLAYGLWEQTRLLTWLNAHPGAVRAPGRLGAELDAFSHTMIGWLLVWMSVPALIGITLQNWFKTHTAWNKIFLALVNPRGQVVLSAICLFAIPYALYLAAKALHAFVWEGALPSWSLVGFVFVLFYGGVACLMQAVREQMRITIPPPQADKTGLLPPEQLTPIHAAIFAGRTNDAFKLYHIANGEKPTRKIVDYKNFLALEAELKLSHPEKFSAEALSQRIKNRNWVMGLWWSFVLLVGLGMLLLPQQSPWWLVWLLYGLVFGAFIRAMSANKLSGWKNAYQSMRRWVRFLAWVLVACFALAIPGLALISFRFIAHSSSPIDPKIGLFDCGIVAGWLLAHLLLAKRKMRDNVST
jgi:tRNA A-37 threonylcarbamoyl transferase component Bud32